MRTSVIPMTPMPLSAEHAGAMLQRQIKKHHVAIVLLHWFNAFVWLFELGTGLALISAPQFRVVPAGYIALLQGIFETRADMLRFHVALGMLWAGVFLVYGIFGFRTYLSQEVLQREIALDKDDVRWLLVRTLRILGRSREGLPPQGIYNAGQKLFALLVYAMLPLVMVSGLVMAFRFTSPQVVGWAMVVHFAAVGAVVSGLIIHVYMGAVFPEEKPAFFSMITGTVNELYAYNHHFKWWRQIKAEEGAWEHQHDDAAPGPTASTTDAAPPSDALASAPAASVGSGQE